MLCNLSNQDRLSRQTLYNHSTVGLFTLFGVELRLLVLYRSDDDDRYLLLAHKT